MAAAYQSNVRLSRGTPESMGVPSSAIVSLLDAAEAQGQDQEFHSLMIVRRGHVIAEGWWAPYRADLRHLLYSLSKSFTSTAVGLAVHEGRLALDDQVIGFFPGQAPDSPSANLAAMRVRHLLTMSTGIAEDPLSNLSFRQDADWVAGFLASDVAFEPGSRFSYSSGATFMLSAILQRLTGETVLDYLRPRLLDPLGISEASWDMNPQGIVVGGWGMSLCTESIAKFGQLYLQDGMWDGRRLLPEGWVAEATRRHIDNGPNPSPDWSSGYGYQFWRCAHEAYRGDGAFGQLCVVVPGLDLVVAVTARVAFIDKALNLVWDHLLPNAAPQALAEDPSSAESLKARLQALEIKGPAETASSPMEPTVSGKTFSGDGEIKSMRWTFDHEGCLLEFANGSSHSLRARHNGWLTGDCDFENDRDQPVAAWGAWSSPDTYSICLHYLEEPRSLVFRARFNGDMVDVETEFRGRFGDSAGPSFRGRTA